MSDTPHPQQLGESGGGVVDLTTFPAIQHNSFILQTMKSCLQIKGKKGLL